MENLTCLCIYMDSIVCVIFNMFTAEKSLICSEPVGLWHLQIEICSEAEGRMGRGEG